VHANDEEEMRVKRMHVFQRLWKKSRRYNEA
jgi:hypothetical protein